MPLSHGSTFGMKAPIKRFPTAFSIITAKSPTVMPVIRGIVFLNPKRRAVFIAKIIFGPGV